MFKIAITTLAIAIGLAVSVHSAINEARVTVQGDQRCIVSNGIPDHSVGQFPNRGNPHAIEVQDITFCVDATPEKGTTAQVVRTVGIAENGVIIRPGTADWYDASSPRGHSRDSASGWNLDGIGASDLLGLDDNNAHVGPGGVYHYHGVPAAWLDTSEDTLLGWAADGFEIHYVGDSAQPSYVLKSGERQTAPYGAHDGTYNQDFEYVAGAGNLDECNGATVNGEYIYFATDTYPFYPRCLFGTEVTNYGGPRG